MKKEEIKQWVSEVSDFSSQFNTNSYAAKNIIGPPKFYPKYGDASECWAPKDWCGKMEFLELIYSTPVVPNQISVYETFNPGALIKVSCKNLITKNWDIIWEGPIQKNVGASSVINKIDLKQVNYLTNMIRLDIDTTKQANWYEIDAVELIGSNTTTTTSSPPPLPPLPLKTNEINQQKLIKTETPPNNEEIKDLIKKRSFKVLESLKLQISSSIHTDYIDKDPIFGTRYGSKLISVKFSDNNIILTKDSSSVQFEAQLYPTYIYGEDGPFEKLYSFIKKEGNTYILSIKNRFGSNQKMTGLLYLF